MQDAIDIQQMADFAVFMLALAIFATGAAVYLAKIGISRGIRFIRNRRVSPAM